MEDIERASGDNAGVGHDESIDRARPALPARVLQDELVLAGVLLVAVDAVLPMEWRFDINDLDVLARIVVDNDVRS